MAARRQAALRRGSLVAGAALAACAQAPREAARAGASALTAERVQRVSVSDSGAELSTCTSTRPSCKNASHPTISYDGLRIAFDCDAHEVVREAPNSDHLQLVYVRDLAAQRTWLASAGRDSDGALVLPDAPCGFGEITGDGRQVLFASGASNLTAQDDEGADVFAGLIEEQRVECVTAGLPGDWADPSPSFDGRCVALTSSGSSFARLRRAAVGPIDGRPSGAGDVFVLERDTGDLEWVSHRPDGTASNGSSAQPVIDEQGHVVAFMSDATDLVELDANGSELDIFARDRRSGELVCVSRTHAGRDGGDGVSRKPSISGNGRFVAFESVASNLLPPGEDTNGRSDVFVHDLATRTTVRVSVTSDGREARAQSGYSAISPDGRFVAFTSLARNLAPGGSGGVSQFYVRDRDASGDGVFDESGDARTLRLSTGPTGEPANGRSGGNCDLSGDGRAAVFMSEGDGLVPFDTNGAKPGERCSPTCLFGRDVFVGRLP